MTPTKTYRQRRKKTIQFLTQDETRRLFKTIKKLRDRALFLTAYRHGLRASDLKIKKLGIFQTVGGSMCIDLAQ